MAKSDVRRGLYHDNRKHTAKEQRLRELESQSAQQRERNSQLSAELEQLREEMRRAAASPAVPPSRSTIFSFLLL